MRIAAKARFESKINKTDTCWLWIGAFWDSAPKDYGAFWLNGRIIRAHQASWLLFRGPIPQGKDVCHTCKTPRCVNPKHLYLATHSKGVANGRAVLTPAKVSHIRANKKSTKALASGFGVTLRTIYHIRSGKTWNIP